MKKLIFLNFYLLLLIIAGCSHIIKFQPKKAQQLRIASYNMNWGEPEWRLNNPIATLLAIKRVNADVIFLQETSIYWERLIHAYLGNMYKYHEFNHFYLERGTGILSKYPLHIEKYIGSLSGWYPARYGYVSTPLGKISYLGIYCLPTLHNKQDIKLPYYSILSAGAIRVKDAENYFPYLNHGLPTIIAGDFNEYEDGFTVNFLKRHGYIDTTNFLSAPAYTWHWPLSAWPTLKNKLDYIFYQPGSLRAVKAQVFYGGGSDHYPLVIDFVK
ncbi:hypothetical protein BH10PSE19_BH10PSE19_20890 [soil metagenome]